jgi:hypothetical protein
MSSRELNGCDPQQIPPKNVLCFCSPYLLTDNLACQSLLPGIVVGVNMARARYSSTITVPTANGCVIRVRHSNAENKSLLNRSCTFPTGLEPIEEVDEDETPSDSVHIPSIRPSYPRTRSSLRGLQGGHTHRKRRYTWYCCQCEAGPNSAEYDPKCLECYHERCGDCKVETRKA